MNKRVIEFKLTEEMILQLLKGKKIQYKSDSGSVMIYPPQGYVTMTYEEFYHLKEMVSIAENSQEIIEFMKKIS